MIFLNCNIRWGHSTKSRRASYNLKKKHLENMSLQIFMENHRDFLFYFHLINAYESKCRFCRKRLFCCDPLFVNHSHFWTVRATDPRLVSDERYFDVVSGKTSVKRLMWYFWQLCEQQINSWLKFWLGNRFSYCLKWRTIEKKFSSLYFLKLV